MSVELKLYKPLFDEECLYFLDQRKQGKMQNVPGPSQNNVDNPNNVRCEANRHFREVKKENLKAKIDEHEINCNTKNIRYMYKGINDFKKGYQPRTNVVKDERVTWLRTGIVFWLGG